MLVWLRDICSCVGDQSQGVLHARQAWIRVSFILSFSHRKDPGRFEKEQEVLSICGKRKGSEAARGQEDKCYRHTMGHPCHHGVVRKPQCTTICKWGHWTEVFYFCLRLG